MTIAFPYNNPNAFIQQRLALYSQTELQIYGDERELTVIKDGRHETYPAGHTAYRALIEKCKNTVSVYFALAAWDEDGGSRVIFPDGLGLYRLRFTSRNSLMNLNASIKEVQKFTGNQIAGVPFNLALDFCEVAGPDGKKRTIPCWTFKMKPPEMLSSRTFRPIMNSALAEGQALMLPVPTSETIETAQTDIIDIDLEAPTDTEARRISDGGKCDKQHFTSVWFATVRDTSLDSAEARKQFILEHTDGSYGSLRVFLDEATNDQASRLIAAMLAHLAQTGEIRTPDSRDEYERIYGQDESEQAAAVAPLPTPAPVIEAEAREIAPPEPPDDEELLAAVADEMDDDAPTADDRIAADESEDPVQVLDFGLCMEMWEAADGSLGIPKPLARGKPDYYRQWYGIYQSKTQREVNA